MLHKQVSTSVSNDCYVCTHRSVLYGEICNTTHFELLWAESVDSGWITIFTLLCRDGTNHFIFLWYPCRARRLSTWDIDFQELVYWCFVQRNLARPRAESIGICGRRVQFTKEGTMKTIICSYRHPPKEKEAVKNIHSSNRCCCRDIQHWDCKEDEPKLLYNTEEGSAGR